MPEELPTGGNEEMVAEVAPMYLKKFVSEAFSKEQKELMLASESILIPVVVGANQSSEVDEAATPAQNGSKSVYLVHL